MRMMACLILMLFVCQRDEAQELHVVSLNEISDKISLPQRFDFNDNPCAIVQVLANGVGDSLSFKGSISGDVVHEDSLYLVYVPGRTKKLTIYNGNYLPLEVDFTTFTDNNIGLKGGCIYKLKLAPNAVSTNNVSASFSKGSRLLVFSSATPLANLIVNGKKWKLPHGSARRLLPYGIYDYEAIATDGRRCSGKVELKPSFGSKIVNIKF